MSIDWPKDDELKELQRNAFYSAILLPFRGFDYTIKKGKKSKADKVYNYVMVESLKQANKAKNFTSSCLSHLDTLIESSNQEDFDVLKIGNMVKQLGELLKPTLLLAASYECFEQNYQNSDEILDKEVITKYVLKYEEFYAKMKEYKIHKAHEIKTLLNGKEIMTLYQIKGGKQLRTLTEEVFKWQLLNPEGTQEEIKAYMLENKEKFLNE